MQRAPDFAFACGHPNGVANFCAIECPPCTIATRQRLAERKAASIARARAAVQ